MAALLAAPLFWGALVLSGLALVLRGLLREHRQDRFRALQRAALGVVSVALPVSVTVFIFPGLSDDIRAVLFGALVGAVGWTITYLQGLSQAEEDQLDLLEALRAEMMVVLTGLDKNPPLATADRIDVLIAAALANGDDYTPYIPLPSRPVVFEALAGRVDQMPTEVVDPVVKYYSLTADVLAYWENLRSAPFLALTLRRRQLAYRQYFETVDTQRYLARKAITAINRRLGVPDPDVPAQPSRAAANTAAADVSRTDPARSGQESALRVSE